jgi:hypothetical protein
MKGRRQPCGEDVGVMATILNGGSVMGSLLRMVVLFFAVAFAADAMAKDYGQYGNVDPVIRKWVQGLKDKSGHGCCDTADGYPAEYEWDVAAKGYKVRIEGEWYVVPDDAVIDQPNKLGYATVWYWWSWDMDGKKNHHIRCFLPGTGG